MTLSTVAGVSNGSRNRSTSAASMYPEIGAVSATDASSSTPMGGAASAAGAGTGVAGGPATALQDIPPDMAVLLQKLDDDFADRSIDQWTYINRREEILQTVHRLHQQQQQQRQQRDGAVQAQLECPLYPRRAAKPPTTTTADSESASNGPSSAPDLLYILAKRAALYKQDQAIICLDARGKETSGMIWEKLYLKAVKVAYEIKHKVAPKNADTVVLLYKDNEVAEFAVALFACFMANVTAIPVHQDISLPEVLDIIRLTSARLVLSSDTVAKELEKLSDGSGSGSGSGSSGATGGSGSGSGGGSSTTSKFSWPAKLMRWRTSDMGSAKRSELVSWVSRQNQQQLAQQRQKSDLAYVEFSRSPVGELRGIAVSHRTIQHQMNTLKDTLSSLPNGGASLQRSVKEVQRSRRVFLATLDTRFSIGLIMGVLFTVYSGNMLVWAPQKVMEIQGLYAHIISKFHASLLLADYIGLKRVTYDYQSSPNATRYFSKTQRVDFSSVKWVLVNASTVDGEFMEVLSERYLKPLGCSDGENAVIPMLTLSEYGGMVISMRDWLGSTSSSTSSNTSGAGAASGSASGSASASVSVSANGDGSSINGGGGATSTAATAAAAAATAASAAEAAACATLSAVLIDRESLTRNIVKIVNSNPTSDDTPHDTLRVDAFGYPIPDATLAVVNPESSILARKGELGEIWIDSPCLSGGFYALRNESKAIFHAKCRDANGTLEMDFLRTGLLGFTYNGKVYVLGLYEDRIRQRVSWMDQELYRKLGKELVVGNGSRYHYSSHLLATLAQEVRQIYDCTIFDIFLGNEYLPVAIVEAEVIRKVVDGDDSSLEGKSGKSGKSGAGGAGGVGGHGHRSDGVSASGNGSGGGNSQESTVTYGPVPLNEPLLNQIAQRCFDTLYKRHYLRLYCVLVVDCDTLPKIMRSGGKEIANMLCKRRFLDGSLRGEFVKFFIRKSISIVPHGEDPLGGIWSPYVSSLRRATLQGFIEQRSTIDYREKSIDDRTGAPLSDFKTIVDVLKFRVSNAGDSVAYQSLDSTSSKNKSLTWKKLEQRIYAVCSYLIEKAAVRPGQHVVLMYSLSEEFVVACMACFMCGIIAIPMLPFDSNRIGEDFPAFVGVVRDFDVVEILVNEEVEKFLKNGPVADAIKKMNHRRTKPVHLKNTAKLTKFGSAASLNSKISKYQATANFRDEGCVALVWLNFTSDHYRVGATLSHKNIMGICKVFKETCNLSSKSALVGCVRHSAGIGFVQSVLLGCYLGTTTYLCSPVSYAENPLAFFLSLARYKVKDVFVTEQMLKYAAIKFTPKGFNLSALKNMMISTEGRVEIDLLRKIARVFQPAKLSAASMSTVYCHTFNPVIATRSYMTVAPVGLYLDPVALRQGYVSVVNPSETPTALYVQDSGMVPVCTQIAVVNPETCTICNEGEFGEIWVCSEANLTGFSNGPKGPVDTFSQKQFLGKIKSSETGQEEELTYLRTGDLGFLHHISITKTRSEESTHDAAAAAAAAAGASGEDGDSSTISFQPLFVLGKISDTFEVMGLHHFPIDVENTIESCHHDIYKNGSCVFKCADYTVVVCESRRPRHVASLVPLIANTVLSKHHLIVDIVAFMKKGQFPISRLGTKQRARIVDAWVQGVLPVVASYGVNTGKNSMIKLVKEIDEVAKADPVTGLRNPALSYYDEDYGDDVFGDNHESHLTLNWDHKN
ncbi:hypothetical protein CAAN4_C08812 [[Candida] anglica]|uniref:Uncharacterized protein n=1 Tax=[Candida] anglica TaxID=148631 RepID=A0ABP0EB64_9ASCO